MPSQCLLQDSSPRKVRSGFLIAGLGLGMTLLLLVVLGPVPAMAQSVDAFPGDVRIEIINATTGDPGNCERLTIDYISARANNLVDLRPSDTIFTIASVPLIEGGKYVVTAWRQGVPYFFSYRGRDMTGDTLTLHVFDTTDQLQDVVITGMNLVVQRQETVLRLEYLLQVNNRTGPQYTVLGSPHTFTILVPPGSEDLTAEYHRGLDPVAIPFAWVDSGKLGLTVPLTWGPNKIHITAAVPWSEGMELARVSVLPTTPPGSDQACGSEGWHDSFSTRQSGGSARPRGEYPRNSPADRYSR